MQVIFFLLGAIAGECVIIEGGWIGRREGGGGGGQQEGEIGRGATRRERQGWGNEEG